MVPTSCFVAFRKLRCQRRRSVHDRLDFDLYIRRKGFRLEDFENEREFARNIWNHWFDEVSCARANVVVTLLPVAPVRWLFSPKTPFLVFRDFVTQEQHTRTPINPSVPKSVQWLFFFFLWFVCFSMFNPKDLNATPSVHLMARIRF